MRISELMTQPVRRIDEGSSIQEAVEIMGEEHFGTLLVTQNGEDIGIITSGDIISKAVAEKEDLETTKVRELMSAPLVTTDKKTTGEDALTTMVENDVRRLLITDEEEIVGVFTTSDVAKLVP